MKENPVAAEMRLYALEVMVSSHLAAIHLQSGDAAQSLNGLRTLLIEKTRRTPLIGLDPAMSDLASAELEDAFDRLIRLQASFLGVTIP